MGPTQRRYSKEELARRGEEAYGRDVQPHLTTADRGKFAAVDVDTGAYEVHADELTACNRLRERVPDAQIWLVRVGAPFVYRFGSLRV
jgi:hypothetical protein